MTAATRSQNFRKILLTGGTGFVGCYLAPAIARAWPDADKMILCAPQESVKRENWRAVKAAIEDEGAVEALVADFQPDLVLHLAAQASVTGSEKESAAAWRVNFNGSMALALAVARHCPAATFLFVSSSEIYGKSFNWGPADEETPARPLNVYARTKMAAEAMLGDILRSDQRLIVARPFNHTGPGQDRRFALPSFAAQIAEIEAGLRAPVLEVGNLDPCRDILHVSDVCAAYLALLGAETGPRNVFNIASGSAWRIGGLLEAFKARARCAFEIRVDPARVRPVEIPKAIGKAEKILHAAGWRPSVSVDLVLRDLLDHWARRNLGARAGMTAPEESAKNLRIRILEAQVEHLSAEHELLKKRYAEAVYSVAWHIAWPVRIVERALRKRRANKPAAVTKTLAPPIESAPPSAEDIARKILALRD